MTEVVFCYHYRNNVRRVLHVEQLNLYVRAKVMMDILLLTKLTGSLTDGDGEPREAARGARFTLDP